MLYMREISIMSKLFLDIFHEIFLLRFKILLFKQLFQI